MKLKNLLILLVMVLCQTVHAQQREHTVERGETLASIAKKYGLSEAQLKAANPNMTMCFAGVRLVIPDPNASATTSNDNVSDVSSKKGKSKSDEKNDTTSHKGGFNKLLKSAGKSLGKTVKVAGAVAAAAVVTKLKGGSYYDAINNAIEAADSTLSGGKNEHGISSLLRTNSKKAREKVTELVDDAKEKGAAAVKEGIDEVMAKVEAEIDPEMEKLYEEYKAKYDVFVSELEQEKNVYTKANTVAKQRTWKNVSDATKDFKTQLEKVRTECEMYTGRVITASAVESWVPISPKR